MPSGTRPDQPQLALILGEGRRFVQVRVTEQLDASGAVRAQNVGHPLRAGGRFPPRRASRGPSC